MTTNDQVILKDILRERRAEIAPDMSESAFFEIFVAEQILKDRDLSWDELSRGVIDGGGDGGIDAAYVFVNGTLIEEDTDLSIFSGDIRIEVTLVQAKRTEGFGETPIQKLRTSVDHLLDLTVDLNEYETTYNAEVLTFFRRFREVHKRFANKLPSLDFSFSYVTLGTEVHPNVQLQVQALKGTVAGHFRDARFSFEFVGAPELLQTVRKRPRTTYELRYQEASPGEGGYICLVQLSDYVRFISDENERLSHGLFDANVRDHQGDVQVNRGIRETLQERGKEDFWWLNNGVTIVADRIVSSGKTLTIENPQIVNGLQTSVELYNHLSSKEESDSRAMLVRVVAPGDPASYEKIIRATNSQTAIPVASLKATDRIHRDIEDYLSPRGWYYERRKNFYKNEGKPLARIITISHLAQATMAMLLGRPNDARARPSTLLKRDEDYDRIFSRDYPLAVYLVLGDLMKRVESFLRSHEDNLEAKEVNNLRFYVAFVLVRFALGTLDVDAPQLGGLDPEDVGDDLLFRAYDLARTVYEELGGDDTVAKGVDFKAELARRIPEGVAE